MYDNTTGALTIALIDGKSSRRQVYAGCAPVAQAKNDRGRGSCLNTKPGRKGEAAVQLQSKIQARQWTASKLRERERLRAEREM